MRRSWKSLCLLIGLIIVINPLLSGCSSSQSKEGGQISGQSTSIVFADAEWESIKVHNRIAGYIVEHGYGYQPIYLSGETLPLFAALSRGDVDIMMEVWTSDYPEQWKDLLKSSKVKALGSNYSAVQGWFVPAYLVEGDTERGIEPLLPALKSVQNLPIYKETFKLSPTSSMGIIVNAPRGWPAETINTEKFASYKLSTSFMLMASDSEQNLSASLDQAYSRGTAWLGYVREPSIISAGHKMLLLREEPYSEEQWKLGRACSYPESNVMKAANSGMNEKAPELLDFLQKYATTRGQNEEILLYVENESANREKAAEEWLRKNPDVWSQWVSEDVAKKIWTSLNPVPQNKKSFFGKFLSK
ncbi:MAG: ABC transporter substrate-binding protein [Firmicutes bacterium HGW-Firmicutes-15]|nr:MAG: ABC transporter substrate-binding protein [Firmicutes bacterium HGW-Firmicutes-15]